ncbi:DUF308 domain-containing protein [Nocardioides sp. W7]|uniref:HdeD family acid-resistance protein n=1 Tax=Nocardioides sp. W7 TaxID=2931390 RepID=UPI001FD29B86|nr:DUF308 domain-containing protein [Nocardioides sp. W7]
MSQSPLDVASSQAQAASPDETRSLPYGAVPPGLNRLADHWGLVLAYGVMTLGIGVVLAAWPDETLKVCAVLVGIQFLVSGVVRIVAAVGTSSLDGGIRALMGLSGALALIVGLLCLRDPLQTVVAIGILLGAWWLVSGVIDIIGALVSPVPGRRGWDLTTGLLSVLAGGFLLIYPELSLGVFVLVACLWLFAIGLLAVVAAFTLRSARGRHPASAG